MFKPSHYYAFIMQIAAFNTAAKLTQRKYGISSAAAILDTRKKLKTVASTASQRITIFPNAIKGCFKPKNIGVHRKLKTS